MYYQDVANFDHSANDVNLLAIQALKRSLTKYLVSLNQNTESDIMFMTSIHLP